MYNNIKKRIELLKNGKCEICGFDRYVENCHIIPKRLGGGRDALNLITLCPNHHKLFDLGLLNNEETKKIEHYLLALIEDYKYKEDNIIDIKKKEYLYFMLRIKNTPPKYLQNSESRRVLKEKLSNSYF